MSQNDFNEFKDLGRQIKDSVMSVVNMQEFNDLKTTIKAATQDLSKDLKSAFKTGVPPTGPVPPSARIRSPFSSITSLSTIAP